MAAKQTDSRVSPCFEHGQDYLHLMAQAKANKAPIIPTHEMGYYCNAHRCELIQGTRDRQNPGGGTEPVRIKENPRHGLVFDHAQAVKIVEVGRRFDLTVSESVLAFMISQGSATEALRADVERGPKIRWQGADEDGSGSVEDAVRYLRGVPAKDPEPATQAEAPRPAQTVRTASQGHLKAKAAS